MFQTLRMCSFDFIPQYSMLAGATAIFAAISLCYSKADKNFFQMLHPPDAQQNLVNPHPAVMKSTL